MEKQSLIWTRDSEIKNHRLTYNQVRAHQRRSDPCGLSLAFLEVVKKIQEEDTKAEQHPIEDDHDEKARKTHDPPITPVRSGGVEGRCGTMNL